MRAEDSRPETTASCFVCPYSSARISPSSFLCLFLCPCAEHIPSTFLSVRVRTAARILADEWGRRMGDRRRQRNGGKGMRAEDSRSETPSSPFVCQYFSVPIPLPPFLCPNSAALCVSGRHRFLVFVRGGGNTPPPPLTELLA